jgi:tryptophanyl-tRNA synthetase
MLISIPVNAKRDLSYAFPLARPARLYYNIPMSTRSDKPRVLTGDTPTGRLHLGHYVGSIENRLAMQHTHDCFFIIANVHALTSKERLENPAEVRDSVIQITTDYLAAGIDPAIATIFLQSEIPAIAELTFLFAMMVPYNRVMRNPTLKTEIELKDLGDTYSFGFPMYAVGQMADILAFRPDWVPVGEDQVAHIEMCREVARRFDQLYCGVDPHAEDAAYAKAAVFPIPQAKVGRIARLSGITTGPDDKRKMSKSLGNALFLSDSAKEVQKKCNKIWTGRQSPAEPGRIEGNTLWEWHDAFNGDKAEVAQMKARYIKGDNIGDGEVKKRLAEVINTLLDPIRKRRAELEADPRRVIDVLKAGTAKANAAAEETLWLAKQAMKFDFFPRELRMK